jgi:hypothetical protein
MYSLCVNVYCHRVSTQLQLTNISISISITETVCVCACVRARVRACVNTHRCRPVLVSPFGLIFCFVACKSLQVLESFSRNWIFCKFLGALSVSQTTAPSD